MSLSSRTKNRPINELDNGREDFVKLHSICMIISDLSAGGAERVFSQLANAWAAEGRLVSVVTLSDSTADFFKLSPEIRRISIGGLAPSTSKTSSIVANIRRLKALRRALKATGATRVLSFTGSMNSLTILASRGLGLQIYISERNDPERQSLGWCWDLMRKRTYPLADRVTANSRNALSSLTRFVSTEKLSFVPNPIARSESSAKAQFKKPTILTVGSLTTQKAQDVLIDAFAQNASADKDWRLAIIGSGENDRALRRQAAQLGIADRLDFLGQVSDPFPYYQAAGIFALPSRFEGTPNALLEAMNSSLPCIVSDASGGPLEYIVNDKTGLVVATDNVEQLATALMRLMNDPELRLKLGQAAYQRLRGQTFGMAIDAWSKVLDFPPILKSDMLPQPMNLDSERHGS